MQGYPHSPGLAVLRALVQTALMATLLITTVCSLRCEDEVQREVLVWFIEGIIEMPPGQTTATLGEVTINSADVCSVLNRYDVEHIFQPFPDFDPADTLMYTDDSTTIVTINLLDCFTIRLAQSENRDSLVHLYTTWEVRLAEPHRLIEYDTQVNDPDFDKQWGLHNQGQMGGTPGEDIDALKAWGTHHGSGQVGIGIIDNGVDKYHEDLIGRVSTSDGYGGGGLEGHGTLIAGVAGALTDNSIGIAGVDWCAGIKAKQTSTSNMWEVYDDIIQVMKEGADVLNLSWSSTEPCLVTRFALSTAYLLDKLSVAAIGNKGDDSKGWPAAYWITVAVGASNNVGERSYFSNYGNHIDVVAPGGHNLFPYCDERDIYSTYPGDSYVYIGGTSFATPFVVGTAALVKGASGLQGANYLSSVVKYTAEDKLPSGWDQETGWGRVNADSALTVTQLPYQHFDESASGGSDYSCTDWYRTYFPRRGRERGQIGWAVKCHEVRKTVSLPHTDFEMALAWGRKETVGWNKGEYWPYSKFPFFQEARVEYEEGWCEAVPGSMTGTHVTLRTYVDEVRRINQAGQLYGDTYWWPATPSGVEFQYTIMGRRPLHAPTNLQAEDIAEDEVLLTWVDNSPNEMGFKVEVLGGEYPDWTELMNAAEQNATSYTASGLQRGTTHHFRIRAYAQDYHSGYSNEVSVTTPWLYAPTDLSVLATSHFDVDLEWVDNSGFTVGFELWRGTEPDALGAYTSVYEPFYSDANVDAYKWYFYEVRAFDSFPHYSDFSNMDAGFTSSIVGNPSFGNGSKLACRDGILYLTYGREGLIWYRESLDGGATWSDEQLVSAGLFSCAHPTIAVSPNGRRCVAWDDGNKIYYAYTKEDQTWQQPAIVWDPCCGGAGASRPSISIDPLEYVHLVWETIELDDCVPIEFYYQIRYATFPDCVVDPVHRVVYTSHGPQGRPCRYASIANIGPTPHVVWEAGSFPHRQIYHSVFDGQGWATAEQISIAGHSSRNPSMAATNSGLVFAVWSDVSGDVVLFRQHDGFSWSSHETVASISDDTYPVVLSGDAIPYVAWSDSDIYYSRRSGADWSSPEKLLETAGTSSAVALAYWHNPSMLNAYLYAIWLETGEWDEKLYIGFISKSIDDEPNMRHRGMRGGPMTGEMRTVPLPRVFAISACRPNPLHNWTVVEYQVPIVAKTHVSVFDANGRMVGDLVNETKTPGFHSIRWRSEGLPAGIYFCRLQAGDVTDVMKIVLLR